MLPHSWLSLRIAAVEEPPVFAQPVPCVLERQQLLLEEALLLSQCSPARAPASCQNYSFTYLLGQGNEYSLGISPGPSRWQRERLTFGAMPVFLEQRKHQ